MTIFLGHLRRGERLERIAEETAFSRFSLSRWFRGKAHPKIPDFLRLLAALTGRVLDFLSLLVDPSELPSVATRWKALEAARRSAYESPWAHAVLRAMELDEFAKTREPVPWLARRLTLSQRQVSKALAMLVTAGQVARTKQGYRPTDPEIVDTRLQSQKDPNGSRMLKSFWLGEAQPRLNEAQPGIYGYNLMCISKKDEPRLLELHLRYFREMQALVAKSSPAEKVVLFSAQLIPLA